MKYIDNKVCDIKIAYIGGGSKGWAWGLMSDLAMAEDISGDVYLYDIDYSAAKKNEIIGNKIKNLEKSNSDWNYIAVENIETAMNGADFVVISILPGTFDEMESDVHCPEKFGIYQPVGDTTGPGGIIRALRTIPMIEYIGKKVKECCPNAWVINYTNPMAVCVNTLYNAFPQIKAFGCCHEVFGTQDLLRAALEKVCDIKDIKREEINVKVLGVNHFTWITKAQYKNMDLFPVYRQFIELCRKSGYKFEDTDHWINSAWISDQKVKFDLFDRYGYIAAAGDRHLVEFCEKNWYLKNPEYLKEWGVELTTVAWRKNDLKEREEKSQKLLNGEIDFEIKETGEEGVNQIRALLGLTKLVTNVNIPNRGQIPNLPMGVVVETNACFRSDSVEPVFTGEIPHNIHPLISRIAGEQLMVCESGFKRDVNIAYSAFINNPLVDISTEDAKTLFDEMITNTKMYLSEYNI